MQGHFDGSVGWGPLSISNDLYPWAYFHVRTNGQIFLSSGCVGC
jgi:hypothetical protein